MAGVILNGSTSGSVTLDPPAVAGSTVITLPSTSGTMITTASSGQSIPKAALPTGSVLQVVQGSTQTQVSSSTTTYADTGLSATITPSSATSKILVLCTQGCARRLGNTQSSVNIKLFRNSTDLGRVAYGIFYTNTSTIFYGSTSFEYLDSPSTTSAITYKTQFNNDVAAFGVSVQTDDNALSTITLMEIAA